MGFFSDEIDYVKVGSLVWIPASVEIKRFHHRGKTPAHVKDILKKFNFTSNQLIPTQVDKTKERVIALVSDEFQDIYEVIIGGAVWYVKKNVVFPVK